MSIKIVFLDADTVGRDVSWDEIERLGELVIYPTTSSKEVFSRINQADIVITNKVLIDKKAINAAPNLRLICIAATGINNVDLEYARKKGIAVTNVPGYSTQSVVQMTFAMCLYLLVHLPYYDSYVKDGSYIQSPIFTHLDRPFLELYGKTWGIIGLGAIGQGVARVAKCFGCRVMYYSTTGKNFNPNYERVTLDDLLRKSDIISVHAPLTPHTYNLITYEKLKLMSPHAILLNLGRGGIVNEADLARALNEGLIAAAGLDVLEHEPIKQDNPLFKVKDKSKLLITPHIAWASVESRNRLMHEVALNIKAFLEGKTRNRVV